MDPEDVWEWAWGLYNKSMRSLPDCEHNRLWHQYNAHTRMIQQAMLRARDRQEGKEMPTQTGQIVVAASEMDKETFAKHFNRRHRGDLSGMDHLPEDGTLQFAIWQLYVSFHYRLHNTKSTIKHRHQPEAPEYAVDKAIECLIENRDVGWKELAGVAGHVAVFPDTGQIATRINGAVRHHKTVKEATDRLLQTNAL